MAVCLVLISFLPIFSADLLAQENIPQDYDKLREEYKNVLAEKENLLIQVRNLIEYRAKIKDMETNYLKLKEDNLKLKTQLDSIGGEKDLIIIQLKEQNANLTQQVAEFDAKMMEVYQERDDLKNSLEKFEIEYKILPETRKQIARLETEKREASRNYTNAQQELKRMHEEQIDKDAQIEIYRRQNRDFKKNLDDALAKNRELEKKAQELPPRFAELARENKVLIKETALMHYNLGVFYTKNKEYARAVAEFEKAIELNPDDPYAHYNVGYIYAEYLVDRPKAIENFRKFLGLVKTDDKDVDWVKKYILTWQTWEGKKPLK
jgi:tetratricopeptide (TPR) repeat protein